MLANPKRTPEELQFLEDCERLHSGPLTEQEQNLCIDQAIFMGELPEPRLRRTIGKLNL